MMTGLCEVDSTQDSETGEQVALKSVQATGQISGLMLEMTVRQHYCNTSNRNIETVYTLPLAWGAVLMGISAEINGRRQAGMVLEKNEAQHQYEEAITKGDMPVMLEQSSRGLYTINLGNLKSGEEAVIEYQYAQLLRFEQNRIRLSIPTTIAPRYGDAHKDGGLRPHESTDSSRLVEYPFDLSIRIDGEAAKGAIESPSHAITVAVTESGLVATLARNGYLDRDFVLTMDGVNSPSLASVVKDDDGYTALASFCPEIKAAPNMAINLKILVDCSGSMGGESITSAKLALHHVLSGLGANDHFSYSRFGSDILHDFPSMLSAQPSVIERASALVDVTDANLGGTEIEKALHSTFALKGGGEGADVLLITDGEVWDIEKVIKLAQKSGHRIFAIGVGSSPADSLLRQLAEDTGGACDLVGPFEDIEQAITRMFRRIRLQRVTDLRVDWGTEPCIWNTQPPKVLFDGETVHVFAGFSKQLVESPILSFIAHGHDQRIEITAPIPELFDTQTLCRIAGDNRLKTASEIDSVSLAMRYQLVTDKTNLFLVHQREGEDKATELPRLQKILQMQAARWGDGSDYLMCKSICIGTSRALSIVDQMPLGSAQARTPAFLRKDSSNLFSDQTSQQVAFSKSQIGVRPDEVISLINLNLTHPDDLYYVIRFLESMQLPGRVSDYRHEAASLGASSSEIWTVLLLWLAKHFGTEGNLSRQANRALNTLSKEMDVVLLNKLLQVLAGRLSVDMQDYWHEPLVPEVIHA